jgi:PHD/YefM family antitoxin component YafN of YafNO toxin-antitoxin module
VAVLVVQMGHVGRTTGVTGAPGEQAFTQAVGDACRRLLHGVNGWSVSCIPADPASSAYKGNAFCAVHADGNNNPNVAGSSLGHQTGEGNSFAQAVRSAYTQLGWSGPWHPDNYTDNLAHYYGVSAAIAQGNRRAFIFECGTITNPGEKAAMTSPEGIERAALAIGVGAGIIDMEEIDVATPNEIWMFPCVGTDPVTGNKETWPAVNWLTRADYRSLHALDGVNDLKAEVAELKAQLDELSQRQSMNTEDVKTASREGTAEALETGTVQVDINFAGNPSVVEGARS